MLANGKHDTERYFFYDWVEKDIYFIWASQYLLRTQSYLKVTLLTWITMSLIFFCFYHFKITLKMKIKIMNWIFSINCCCFKFQNPYLCCLGKWFLAIFAVLGWGLFNCLDSFAKLDKILYRDVAILNKCYKSLGLKKIPRFNQFINPFQFCINFDILLQLRI